MITPEGYSKDPSLMPEGVVITFGKEMMLEHGGFKTFIQGWLKTLDLDDGTWKHFCKNIPVQDVAYVYVIILNRLAYRCQFAGAEEANLHVTRYKGNGEYQPLEKRGILMCGPVIKCPEKIKLKGFQGFRYCTKLF